MFEFVTRNIVIIIFLDQASGLYTIFSNQAMAFSLFGEGDWEHPWRQYDDGQVKEVCKDALDFCQRTVGLYGPFHDQRGYMVDTQVWDALKRYVEWCKDESIDFLFHVDQLVQRRYLLLKACNCKDGRLHESC